MGHESTESTAYIAKEFPEGCKARDDNPYLVQWITDAFHAGYKECASKNSGNSKNVTQQANTAIALLKKWRDCANDDLWRETMLFLAQIAQQHRQRDEIKRDCGNCLLAGQCTYFGFPSDSCGYSARV